MSERKRRAPTQRDVLDTLLSTPAGRRVLAAMVREADLEDISEEGRKAIRAHFKQAGKLMQETLTEFQRPQRVVAFPSTRLAQPSPQDYRARQRMARERVFLRLEAAREITRVRAKRRLMATCEPVREEPKQP